MASVHWPLRGLAGVFAFLLSGCGTAVSDPTPISITELRDAFHDIEKGNSAWAGKRVLVSGGKIERVRPDHVEVVGDGVRLWCHHDKPTGAVVEKALRGQAVTVTGLVGRQGWTDEMIIKLEGCEFVLGSPPATEGEAVLASRGGDADADRDIKAGHLRLRFVYDRRSGPPPWLSEYKRLLKEHCGVEIDAVSAGAGPVIEGLWPADRDYNNAMVSEIEKWFGAGIVEKLRKQAEGRAGK